MSSHLKVTPTSFYKKIGFLFPIFIIALIFGLLLSSGIIYKVFEFDYDEGINLMKSALFLNGLSLYKEIWNDQPPVFTIILAFWLKIFGSTAYNARLLVMLFSIVLAAAFFQTVKIYSGRIAAAIALISLLFSTAYLRLSVSVMNIIPTLAFTMLSLVCLALYKKHKLKTGLIASGVFMAISLQTKLIFIFLLPLVIEEIFCIAKAKTKDRPPDKPLSSVFLWLSVFLLAYAFITVIFFGGHLNQFFAQLITPNLNYAAPGVKQFGFSVLFAMLSRDYDILILAVICLVFSYKQRKGDLFFIISWLLLAAVLLFMHKPVWYHHYLLISLPLSWLAGVGFSKALQSYRMQEQAVSGNKHCVALACKKILIFVGILTPLFLPFKCSRIIDSLYVDSTGNDKVIAALSAFKEETRWMLTDRPIYAFYLGRLVPAQLCVFSQKRIETNNLKQALFFSCIQRYNPEQILLVRFKNYNQELIDYIESNYTKISEEIIHERIWFPPYRWGFDSVDRPGAQFNFFKLLFPDEELFFQTSEHKAKVYLLKSVRGQQAGQGLDPS